MHAIGTFARDGEPPFPGLLLDDERVVDLSGYGWQDTNQILNGWPAARAVIEGIADGVGDVPLEELRTLAPLQPRQILQSGGQLPQARHRPGCRRGGRAGESLAS